MTTRARQVLYAMADCGVATAEDVLWTSAFVCWFDGQRLYQFYERRLQLNPFRGEKIERMPEKVNYIITTVITVRV